MTFQFEGVPTINKLGACESVLWPMCITDLNLLESPRAGSGLFLTSSKNHLGLYNSMEYHTIRPIYSIYIFLCAS